MTAISYFRSEDYRKGERLAALHDIYASVERVDIDVIGDETPYFSVAMRQLPDVSLLDATISPMSPRRTRQQAGDGKDDIVFAFIERGKVSFQPQGGSAIELKDGEAYLGLNTRASSHTLVGSPQFFDITIPRAALDPRVKVRDYAAIGKLEPGPALTLLKQYAQAVMGAGAMLDNILLGLQTAITPEALLSDLAGRDVAAPGHGIEAIHFFPLGGIAATADFIAQHTADGCEKG